jgi:5-methylcytosine-specific restriction endonuclease McrA
MAYSEDDVNWVYDRTKGACFYCGKLLSFKNYGQVGYTGAWEVDHFIPLASNGADQPYNWVAACVSCNTEKSDMLPWEFDPRRFRTGDRDPDHYL